MTVLLGCAAQVPFLVQQPCLLECDPCLADLPSMVSSINQPLHHLLLVSILDFRELSLHLRFGRPEQSCSLAKRSNCLLAPFFLTQVLAALNLCPSPVVKCEMSPSGSGFVVFRRLLVVVSSLAILLSRVSLPGKFNLAPCSHVL